MRFWFDCLLAPYECQAIFLMCIRGFVLTKLTVLDWVCAVAYLISACVV